MEFDKVIEKRASYRNYNDQDVSYEDLMSVLNAARLAPSSGNLQNWSFIVVRKSELKEEIMKASMNQTWILQAPVLIVVASRNENIKRHYGDRGEKLYSIQNCAASINNLLLKSTDLGLASCWINAFDDQALKRILKLPDTVLPQAIISLGYSNDKVEKLKRYDLDLLVHFDEWNGKQVEGLFPLKQRMLNSNGSSVSETKKTNGFFSNLMNKLKKKPKEEIKPIEHEQQETQVKNNLNSEIIK